MTRRSGPHSRQKRVILDSWGEMLIIFSGVLIPVNFLNVGPHMTRAHIVPNVSLSGQVVMRVSSCNYVWGSIPHQAIPRRRHWIFAKISYASLPNLEKMLQLLGGAHRGS